MDADRVERFFRARRSIRVYKDEPVDRDALRRLIEVARYAPTGHNFQPVEWLAIADKDEVHRLAGLVVDWMKSMIKDHPEQAEQWHMSNIVLAWRFGIDVVLRGAPALVVTHAEKINPAAPAACTIALSYLELAAPSFGLGGCWAGFFDAALASYPPLREALGLPPGHIGLGSMMLGAPRYSYHRLPLRREPKITWR
jgi:nitroreductase